MLQQHFYSHLLLFLRSRLSSTKKEYILGVNRTNSVLATPAVSSIVLPATNLFESSKYFDLAEYY